MTALSFVSMSILMYAMVNSFANVHSNLNQAYMAGLMAAPIVVVEMVVMRGMYHDSRRNAVIAAVTVAAGIAFFMLIREQTGILDRQFLRSMIPHLAGAILMCEESAIRDPDIARLCKAIISSQQSEIEEMKAKLRTLED